MVPWVRFMLNLSLYKLHGHILFSGVLVTYTALLLCRKSVLMINFHTLVFSSHDIKATPAVRSSSFSVGRMRKVFCSWHFICLSWYISVKNLSLQLYSKKTSGQLLRGRISECLCHQMLINLQHRKVFYVYIRRIYKS